jgi:hypothetical protein
LKDRLDTRSQWFPTDQEEKISFTAINKKTEAGVQCTLPFVTKQGRRSIYDKKYNFRCRESTCGVGAGRRNETTWI